MQWTDGMLYPLLHRLEQLGYVSASWGVSDTGRAASTTRSPKRAERWQTRYLPVFGLWAAVAVAVIVIPPVFEFV